MISLEKRCLAEGREGLLAEWHPSKNLPLTPDKIGAKSKSDVWWICGRCGHEWQTKPAYRFGSGKKKPTSCPECAKRPAETLRSWCVSNARLDILKEFDSEGNDFTPDDVSSHSSRSANWVHYDAKSRMFHRWPAIIASRTGPRSAGCPYCAGVKTLTGYNDLATRRPDLLPHWDYERNIIDPSAIPSTAREKVFWKCADCGEETELSVASVARRGHPCRKCRSKARSAARREPPIRGLNDLATTHPAAAAMWHPTKNKDLRPEDVTAEDGRVVWWCFESSVIGRWIEWQDPVRYRVEHLREEGQPELYVHLREGVNDLATTHPLLSREWSDRNELPATKVKIGMRYSGWWTCSCCGHKWRMTTFARRDGAFCPECEKSLSAGAKQLYRTILRRFDAALERTPLGIGVRFRQPLDPRNPTTANTDKPANLLVVTTLLEGWIPFRSENCIEFDGALMVVEAIEQSSRILSLMGESDSVDSVVTQLQKRGAMTTRGFIEEDVDAVFNLVAGVQRQRSPSLPSFFPGTSPSPSQPKLGNVPQLKILNQT